MIFSILLFAQLAAAGTQSENFDKQLGKLSEKDWAIGSFANQGAATWVIQAAKDAPSPPNVLVRTGKAPYSWAVEKNSNFTDGELEVNLNVMSGKEDPEAGIIWGFQDGKNYFYVRTNAVENNIIFYRMHKGKKEHLKEVEAKVSYGTWHKLKIQISGAELTVLFDGKVALSTKNKELSQSGKVGFFTTADSICAFDDWSVTAKAK
jgi:hypothetical protein